LLKDKVVHQKMILKTLAVIFLAANPLLAFDYFGTAPAQYYLDEKFENWNPFQKKPRPSGWFAVSASIKSEGCATPTKGFDETRDHYCWLNDYNPVTAIGNSIYIYDLP